MSQRFLYFAYGSNLKHQQMTIEHGEDKGQVHKAFWQDLVREGHPNIYVEKNDDA